MQLLDEIEHISSGVYMVYTIYVPVLLKGYLTAILILVQEKYTARCCCVRGVYSRMICVSPIRSF